MTTKQHLLTGIMLQAFNVAAPVPLRHNAHNPQTAGGNDALENGNGRDTPLPQYEKTPQSVPFTLDLQEDQSNPGQFQLVVNVNSKLPPAREVAGMPPARRTLSTSLKDISSPVSGISTLYQTQKSSPPTTPSQDKHGWSDLDAIPPDFLKKVVPDWDITFTRNASTASTHSTKLADIKARFKRKGRGYVVRLLKGSTSDPSEVAEVDLGLSVSDNAELDSTQAPAELDSTLVASSQRQNSTQQPSIFEIGTSGEQGVQSLSQPPTTVFGLATTRYSSHGSNLSWRQSISEDSVLSDAETLVSTQSPRGLHPPTRSTSISSIVPTPTRGLSVRSVRRVDKGTRYRAKSKVSSLELKRSDAHKSMKRRSPRGSITHIETGGIFQDHSPESTGLRYRNVPITHNSDETDLVPEDNNTWQHPKRKKSNDKPVHLRRSSADNILKVSRPKAKLHLQTNLPRPKSSNTSPVARKKRHSKPQISPLSSSSSSPVSSHDEAQWSEVNTSRELREALIRVFGNAAKEDRETQKHVPLSIPTIVEPIDEHDVGQIPLPSEFEIRLPPTSTGSPLLKYWMLAFSALTDSVHSTFGALLDRYGTERPIPPQHVRVRWTCVRYHRSMPAKIL
jgi:hypothetical protein